MRKLATAAAVSLVLSSGGAHALGLGDIEMRSALNQPMNAEIRLTSVQPGEASGMIVKLASPDAFARAGIERTGSLTDLRFSVDQSAGAPVIKISSSRPVVEPFLNFLVEVDWPTGRMVREYTVLLDPPVFMSPSSGDRNTASDQPATLQRNNESLSTPSPIQRSGTSDGFDVEIVGSAVEIADNAQLAADGGEVVALDALGSDSSSGGISVELIPDNADSVGGQGDVVVLSDLGVENTEAAAQFQADQNFEFEVEVVGDNTEVSDTFVSDQQNFAGSDVVVSESAESEIVSLDSLDANVTTETDISVNSGNGGEVTVQRGDTLSKIADSVAVQGVSSQQMMMALLNANQNAFINGNVNLVKAGAILRIPEGDELARLTQAQAVAQMGEQNQLWREYRDSVRSAAGTRVATAPVPTPDPEPVAEPETDAVSQPVDQQVDEQVVDEQVEETPTQLSEAAQRILDAAKIEAAGRQELNIVAQGDPTNTSASATADNVDASESAMLGEINQKLALAKEELASTRLESSDLVEQSDELQSTAENMESLVNIRQDEVARLEEALKTATERAEAEKLAAEEAERAAAQAEAEKAAQLEAEQAEAEKIAAAEAEQAALDSDAEGAGVESEPETALTTGSDTASETASEKLESVELVDDAAVPAEAEAVEPVTATGETTPWYAGLLQKYGKWIVVGIGGLCALLLGALLLGKRRKADEDRLVYEDDVDFLDDDDLDNVQLHADGDIGIDASDADTVLAAKTTSAGTAGADASSGVGASAGVAAGAVGAAAAGGAAIASATQSNGGQTAPVGANMDGLDNTSGPDGLDPDDTISEVDVYLAYGLHGQAEELLSKAIDRDPTNHEYALKLLQTQHAQGNADAFAQGAKSYHNSFGGNNAPNWDTICNLGHDLQPNNGLFSGSVVEIENVGKGSDGSENLAADDFTTDENTSIDSVSRDFGDASETASDVDETDLMDESLDPAFAFDETDLEATGDFSQMSSDFAAEEASVEASANVSVNEEKEADDTSLEFPDFNATDSIGEVAEVGKDKLSSVGSTLQASVGGAAAAAAGGLAATAASAKDGVTSASDVFDDSLSLDDIDSAAIAANDGAQGSVAEDLTLDLDQLSGDLQLDGADLHDQTSAGALEDLEIADINSDSELLADNVANIDGSDEMDTMMDLAKAYIDMGDKDSASSALGEIVKGGNPAQVSEAETLLRKIS